MNSASGFAVLIQILPSFLWILFPVMHCLCPYSVSFPHIICCLWSRLKNEMKNQYTMTWVCKVNVWAESSSTSSLAWVLTYERLIDYHLTLCPTCLSILNFSHSAQSRGNIRVWSHYFIAVWLWGNDLTSLSLSFLFCKVRVVIHSLGADVHKALSKGSAETLSWNPCCETLLTFSGFLTYMANPKPGGGCQTSCLRHVINSLGRQFAFKEKQAERIKTSSGPSPEPGQFGTWQQ